MTLAGIDVSAHQLTTPPLAGQDFLIARAAYGSYLDARFGQHIRAARDRGLVTGAYLFGRSVVPVVDQITALSRALASVGGVDLVALDIESDGRDPAMTESEARTAIAAIRSAGHRPGLYHSTSGYPTDAWGADWRWVADYRSIAEPPIPWDIWQWTSFAGDVHLDRNRFRGTRDELLELGGRTVQHDVDVARIDEVLVDIPAGTKILNLDGSARMTASAARTGVLSPFVTTSEGETAMRAVIWTAPEPTPDLLLAVYANAAKNVRPAHEADCDAVVERELEAAAARVRAR